MLPKLIIWGAAGHARVVADMVRLAGVYEPAGFLDDVHPERAGEPFCGATVLGGREQLRRLRAVGDVWAMVAIGNCTARLALAELVCDHGFRLATVIHPRAIVASDAAVGAGTVIAAGAVVNPGAQLGANVIVNTGASVDHDCMLADGVHIGPGAHLGGWVVVERGSWIGIGAAIRDRVRIGASAIVGMGAVVVNDIPPRVIAYGVPARIIREAASDDF
jgi:sugar O-acyltransferase (sialic acid O-acetyltransferase NeuD family)